MKPLKMQVKLMTNTDKPEILGNTHPLTSGIRIALASMCLTVFAAPQNPGEYPRPHRGRSIRDDRRAQGGGLGD